MNGWSNPDVRARGSQRAGFTLIELLAVIVVLVLLAALALPALAGSKGRTKIGQCASNLKQFALTMHVYANDNSDKLPVVGGGNWAFDTPWALGDTLNQYGAPWNVLYCPGTAPRFTDAENIDLYNFVPGSFRVLGYVPAIQNVPSLIVTNMNRTLIPTYISVSGVLLPPPLPSARVLLADATISASGQSDPIQRFNSSYNYTAIAGGYRIPHLSPHLTGRFPVGGNLAMLDGHLEWRPFVEMIPRTNPGPPVFWW